MRTINLLYRWLAGFIWILLITCTAFAQTNGSPELRALSQTPSSPPLFQAQLTAHAKRSLPNAQQVLRPEELANGSVHIVAVMVEFQPDENRFTSGNGTFNPDFLNRDDITIDPLPHDRGYFEAHLQFVKNYFERVSGNRLEITYEVLPEIVTVPEEMAAYSPLGEDNSENFKLAFFARDVWEEVDRKGLLAGRTLDPDRTMYIAFHAGVGRDLELIGTTLFKTPQDIPSVFLSQNSLRRLFENPVFDGFNVNGNVIRNTAILPETQSRPGENIIGEEFVIELSINGILTATIGSFLGLPDLFNTETGASGIGRFGLMDGAGFFSYFGLFPPEPSAWEKAWLGWVTPFDITDEVAASGTVTLRAPTRNGTGTVAKLPISSDEYFLVENRIRDPFEEGLTLTIRTPDGTLETVTISREETRFSHNDLSRIGEIVPPGVLVDVSHFDWSLPGGLDAGEDRQIGTEDDRFLNGGILIWHIDDQIIRSKIDDNAINNNPLRKGVKLVEADAAQDIGRPAGGVTQYAQGAPFDFWWSGNDFTVITQSGQRIILYQNRFADDTRPNNRSNSGSRTYFEFLNFSDNQVEATFDTRPLAASSLYSPVRLPVSLSTRSLGQTSDNGLPLSITRFTSNQDTMLVVPDKGGFLTIDIRQPDTLYYSSAGNSIQPLVHASGLIAGSNPQSFLWNPSDRRFDPAWQFNSNQLARILARSTELPGSVELAGTPVQLDILTGEVSLNRPANHQTSSASGSRADGSLVGNTIQNSTSQGIFAIRDTELTGKRLYLASMLAGSAESLNYLFISDERFIVLEADNGDILSETSAENMGWPFIFDWTGDGKADVLYVNHESGSVEARNQQGAMLEGFPIVLTNNRRFTGTPMVVSGSEPLLLIPSTDGFSYSVEMFTSDNLRTAAETLLIGARRDGLTLIQPAVFEGTLYAVAPGGDIRAWRFQQEFASSSAYIYGQPVHNLAGTTTAGSVESPADRLLVTSETYNWPNPASTDTHIRFMTSSSADVTITAINYTGQQLLESTHQSRGNQPMEVHLNTSSWSNGVYFVRVTARSNGVTEHKVITMVVAR
ncbi:MAG: T9SS type A sorting domain-containing protein [Balneolales bacterium]|nr:T9SS type A sorting domain-containing protein [Balneolales bacterium]